jgi:hypothetical protein
LCVAYFYSLFISLFPCTLSSDLWLENLASM